MERKHIQKSMKHIAHLTTEWLKSVMSTATTLIQKHSPTMDITKRRC